MRKKHKQEKHTSRRLDQNVFNINFLKIDNFSQPQISEHFYIYALKIFVIMKRLCTLLLALVSTSGVFAQEWHIGASIHNNMMFYDNPMPAPGDAVESNLTYHYGALVNVEKGLDLYNQWRIGIEAGFSSSVPIDVAKTTVSGFPPITQITASQTALSWIPVQAVFSYNAFEVRRNVNFRTSLAVGYAIGSGSYEVLPTTQLIGSVPVIIPGSSTNLSWGGITFSYRLGAQFTLKRDAIFLNLEAGYHGIFSDYGGLFPSYDTDGQPSIDPILVNGIELNVGVQFRIFKYRQ